ncbi:MAG: alanine--tRNA ligase, partial [Thermoprotei archaeon]
TKTIALMLGDGIVPSNTGEGYLARLVIRRCLRRLHMLKAEVPLSELVLMQVKYWFYDYPSLARNREYIARIVELEEKRYRSTLTRVSSTVPRLKRKTLNIDELVELYDSHGIPPEIIKEELRKYGVEVIVPPNFYEIVASRHAKPSSLKDLEKTKLPKDVARWATQFPETRRLFHEDPYVRRFKAKVLGVHGRYVVLDKTAFYPEGGGQLGDSGYIIVDNIKYRVVDTQKTGNVIVHILEHEVNDEILLNKTVEGIIDWQKRYRRMRHHTATHIFLGALRKVLGEHVWQAGAEKTEHKARLDVTHYELPSKDTIDQIEKLANTVIDEARPVRILYLPRNEAEKLYGFTLFQGGVPLEPTLRVVEIPGWDAEACFGTHVRNTCEVGAIKIVNVEKIADGVIRFEYVAGPVTSEYASGLESKLDNIATKFGGSRQDIELRVSSWFEQFNTLRELVRKYRELWLKNELELLKNKFVRIDSLEVLYYAPPVEDQEVIRRLIQLLARDRPNAVVLVLTPLSKDQTLFEISLGREASRIINAKNIIKDLARIFGNKVKGGGKKDHAMGRAALSSVELRKALDSILRNMLKQN